jgi:LysM repeat protein
MLKAFVSAAVLSLFAATVVSAQSPAVELANLREDVRLLTQRVGEMQLRMEQLERENAELRSKSSHAAQSYATVAQLNDAVAALNGTIKSSSAAAKADTLQQVSVQMEKLARQTNAALESLAKGVAARSSPVSAPTFTEDYPKEGISYTVQKSDTLALIAKKTGARQQDIINANKLSDPSKIQVGQTLFIPGGK